MDRFWKWVDKSGDCWLWTGTPSQRCGQLYWEGKLRSAHRVAYAISRGPIPKGYVVHHLCEVKRCVNPDHLEAIPASEHQQHHNPRSPWCPKCGPEFAHEWVRRANGEARCKKCAREASRRPPKPQATHCKHGHEWTVENAYVGPDGVRICRTCRRIRNKGYRDADLPKARAVEAERRKRKREVV